MKLYKTTYFKANDGEVRTGVVFDGSAAAASKRRTALKTADKEASPQTTSENVFAKKEQLLQFINALLA